MLVGYSTNPQTSLPASKCASAYYHPKKACIQLKWGTTFYTSNLVIPDAIRDKQNFPEGAASARVCSNVVMSYTVIA